MEVTDAARVSHGLLNHMHGLVHGSPPLPLLAALAISIYTSDKSVWTHSLRLPKYVLLDIIGLVLLPALRTCLSAQSASRLSTKRC